MATYLLAKAARVDGVRYTRGDELPDHDQTKSLTDRGYASSNKDDLAQPFTPPGTGHGPDPKSAERSSILVGDSTGVHTEQTAQSVTNSGDGTRITGRDTQRDNALAESAAEANAKAGGRRK